MYFGSVCSLFSLFLPSLYPPFHSIPPFSALSFTLRHKATSSNPARESRWSLYALLVSAKSRAKPQSQTHFGVFRDQARVWWLQMSFFLLNKISKLKFYVIIKEHICGCFGIETMPSYSLVRNTLDVVLLIGLVELCHNIKTTLKWFWPKNVMKCGLCLFLEWTVPKQLGKY